MLSPAGNLRQTLSATATAAAAAAQSAGIERAGATCDGEQLLQ